MKKQEIEKIIVLVTEAKSFSVLDKKQLLAVSRNCRSNLPDSRLVKLWEQYYDPKEIKDKMKTKNDGEFTQIEIEIIMDIILGESQKTMQDLYDLIGSSHSKRAIQDKIIDLNKKLNKVGSDETNQMKWSRNKAFLDSFDPETITTVLDAYSGRVQWWKNNTSHICNVISNDINKDIKDLDYNLPASHLLYKYCEEDEKSFSIVDLDPYAYNSDIDIERAIKMAEYGVIFTFGDRRALKNAVYRMYDRDSFINTSLERYHTKYYTVDNVKKFIIQTAERLGKKLIEFDQYSTGSIWRVYFKVYPADPEVLCRIATKKSNEAKRLREIAADLLRKKADELDKLAQEDI